MIWERHTYYYLYPQCYASAILFKRVYNVDTYQMELNDVDFTVQETPKSRVKSTTKTARDSPSKSTSKSPRSNSNRKRKTTEDESPVFKTPTRSTLKEQVQRSLDDITEWKECQGVVIRRNARAGLIKALSTSKKDPKTIEILCWAIEAAAYDSCFNQLPLIYMQRIRSLCSHACKDPDRFTTLDPGLVGTMDASEMVKGLDDISMIQEPIKQRDIFQVAFMDGSVLICIQAKSEIRCKQCKSRNVTYFELHTRSADEPATVFYTCENCDAHWRG